MKEFNMTNYDVEDMIGYDDELRFSPTGLEGPAEPYRCPVSTPAGNRRVVRKDHHHSYVSFNNLNRSVQIPNSPSLSKHSNTRYLFKRRALANAPTKNFDCYYVNKVKTEAHIDSQSHPSTWLNSLCSQPVDEIFTKYKRRSEAVDMGNNSTKTRNVSTPGEKALINAWSSNTSNRGSYSSLSRATTKSKASTMSRHSKISVHDNTRLYSFDSTSERTATTVQAPIFALMPVPMSPQKEDFFYTPRESLSLSPENMKRVNINQNNNNLVQESSLLFDSSIYEPYQRDRRFPDIKVRQRSVTPTRKRVSSEPGGVKQSPRQTGQQDLQESAIHIISIGQVFDNKETAVVTKPIQRSCSYRLPKNMSTSLPELQGTSINNPIT